MSQARHSKTKNILTQSYMVEYCPGVEDVSPYGASDFGWICVGIPNHLSMVSDGSDGYKDVFI